MPIKGSQKMHSMRFIFTVDNEIVKDEIQMRQYTCNCHGCLVGIDCLVEENGWKTEKIVKKPNVQVDQQHQEENDQYYVYL